MKRLDDCFNLADFRDAARQRLPSALFHYIDGGADDELTVRSNTTAFDHYRLVPNYLRSISDITTDRTVFGCHVDWPVLLSPTGLNRAFNPSGEIAVARAAAEAGTTYALSGMGTTSIEEIGKATTAPKIFQLYLFNDDALNFALIDRCKAAGFNVLCLTVDCIAAGNRERDLRCGLTVPPTLNRRNLFGFTRHPLWCLRYAASERMTMPNIPTTDGNGSIGTLASYFAQKMEQNITWPAVEKLMRRWDGPFVIKGLQSVADARDAATAGVSGIIVSNHGGRQLGSAAPTIDLIADIADAVGDRLDVVMDGGIRRGTHVVKALAMGARACMIGRPYLYGLSAFGQPGVQRVLTLLRAEIRRTLALLGCASVDALGHSHIRLANQIPQFFTHAAGTNADALPPALLRSSA